MRRIIFAAVVVGALALLDFYVIRPERGDEIAHDPDPMSRAVRCAGGDRAVRVEYLSSKLDDWPQDVQAAIIEGEVRVGFTSDQVKAAKRQCTNRRGEPSAKYADLPAPGGKHGPAWVYHDGVTVFFDGNRVTAVTKSQVFEFD